MCVLIDNLRLVESVGSGLAGSMGSSENVRTSRRVRANSDTDKQAALGRMRRDSSHSGLAWQSASFAAILNNHNTHRGSLLGSLIGSVVDEQRLDEDLGATESTVNLIKCAAGCGMFSLPYAYKQGGLYLSIGGTLFFGAISAYTVVILAAAEVKARSFPIVYDGATFSADGDRIDTPNGFKNLDDGEYVQKGDCDELQP